MAKLQSVRGTRDLLPDDARRHRMVVDTARSVAERYGYAEVATPIFEFTEVFARTLGDTSDIVTKEMYTFTDKGGDSLTLRPEGTAGIARAYMAGELRQINPQKFFYSGPMFRHERPQKGRLRQFHQIGVEILTVASPMADIEVIAMGAHILDALGLKGRVTLEINTLGDGESRQRYREVLVDYLRGHEAKLSEDSRQRLTRNPLRVLDSKDEGDRVVIADAPIFGDYLNEESRAFFDRVLAGLDTLDIGYRISPHLVRGLDYYCHTAFEFTTTELGAQSAVLAGGRYDGLVETMGGPPTPGVGWAAGIERLVMLAADPAPPPRPVAVIPVGDDMIDHALGLAETLRRAGQVVDLAPTGNFSRRLKRANALSARAAVLVGGDEWARGEVGLRDLDSGEQTDVPVGELAERLGAAL